MRIHDPMDDPLVAALAEEMGQPVRFPEGAAEMKYAGDGSGPSGLHTLFVRNDALSGDGQLYVHATFGRDAKVVYKRYEGVARVHVHHPLPDTAVRSLVGRPLSDVIRLPAISPRIVVAADMDGPETIITLADA